MPAERYLLLSVLLISCGGDGLVRAAEEGGAAATSGLPPLSEDNGSSTGTSVTGRTAPDRSRTPAALTAGRRYYGAILLCCRN